jgi:poly(A) polymerase Pap1
MIEFEELEWSDFLLEYPFFHDSLSYIELRIISENEKEFEKWKGLVVARVRYLMLALE